MLDKLPKTPFATRLSGDAKETELRIRNIFQWKKKRPPIWVLALVIILAVGCGGLVAWTAKQPASGVKISMWMQHYDDLGNYAEVPKLEIPADFPEEKKPSLIEINNQLGTLHARYQDALENQDPTVKPFKLLCYPAASDRYLSLLLYEEGWVVGRTAAMDIPLLTSWVYDQEEKQLVTREQALELAAVTEEELLNQLKQEIDKDPMDPWVVQSVELQAFFLDQKEELTLYLAAAMGGVGDTVYDRLYAWKQGAFTEIELIGQLTDDPILPPDATAKMAPALWNEWYYGSGQPDNGFSARNDIAGHLARKGLEDFEFLSVDSITTLLEQTVGARTLVLVEVESTPHIAGLDNLVMGVYDEDTQSFVGDTFDIHGDEPGYTSWWGTDGCLYVLWTNTIYYQGDGTSNGLGYFRFDGRTLEPIYDLPATARNCGVLPDVPELDAILHLTRDHPDSDSFWFTRKARPVGAGFELYEENPDWLPKPTQHTTTDTEVDQWRYVGYVPFAVTDGTVTNGVKDLILEYIETTWFGYERTYYLGEEPGEPQEWDQRIDGVFYAGEERTYETTGVAFRVDRSYYSTWSSEDPGPSWHRDENSIYVILGRSMDGETYTDVRGFVTPNSERSLNQMILEITYGLMDLDVSLWRDGYPWPAGPGNRQILFFRDVYDGEAQVEVLEGWEPIYWPGAYWTRQSWDGFSALCYHVGEEPGQPDPAAYSIYTIDTTRTDLRTYRGIRVGSTRAEVLEAYPTLYDTHYWHDTAPDFPGDDYLWYCVNPDGFGAAILFFFEGDVVSQIRLNHMFN